MTASVPSSQSIDTFFLRPGRLSWYRRTYGRGQRRLVPLCCVTVPPNYASALVGLRHRLGLSQQQLAAKVGAASKAVVYQWESSKRRPSPVLWLRIQRLQRWRERPPATFGGVRP